MILSCMIYYFNRINGCKLKSHNILYLLRGWTWVHSSLTVGQSDVNESSGVQKSLVSSTLWLLWLFGLFDLWSLGLNLTSTS